MNEEIIEWKHLEHYFCSIVVGFQQTLQLLWNRQNKWLQPPFTPTCLYMQKTQHSDPIQPWHRPHESPALSFLHTPLFFAMHFQTAVRLLVNKRDFGAHFPVFQENCWLEVELVIFLKEHSPLCSCNTRKCCFPQIQFNFQKIYWLKTVKTKEIKLLPLSDKAERYRNLDKVFN